MKYEDQLDAIIREALEGDEMPSADLTDKVMERITRTPQKRAVPRRKIIVSIAACAAIAVVVLPILRLSTMRMGSAADCAETECISEEDAAAPAAEDAPAAAEGEQRFTMTADSAAGEVSDEPAEEESDKLKSANGALKSAPSAQHLFVIDDAAMCKAARAWLAENGFPAAEDEQQNQFSLTPEQVVALQQAFPELIIPEDVDLLRLEG